MDFGVAETGIARGSPPGTTAEVLRVGFPFAEIRFVSTGVPSTALCSNWNFMGTIVNIGGKF
jgi:hypothetical protein